MVLGRAFVVGHQSDVDGVLGQLVFALGQQHAKRRHFRQDLFVESELVVFKQFQHAAIRDHAPEFVQEAAAPDGHCFVDKFGVVERQ